MKGEWPDLMAKAASSEVHTFILWEHEEGAGVGVCQIDGLHTAIIFLSTLYPS